MSVSIDTINVCKEAIAQTLGAEYMQKLGDLAALDSYKVADLGKDVLDTDMNTERYTHSLVSILGKNEYIKWSSEDEFASHLFVDDNVWGAFIQRIYFSPIETLQQDPAWHLQNNTDYSSIENKFYAPQTQAKLFSDMKDCLVPVSFQRDRLTESFRSWEAVDAYLSEIRAMLQETIKLVRESHAKMLAACAIAMSNSSSSMNTARHLLTEAKQKGIVADDMTAAQAIQDADFLAYAAEVISTTKDYMKVASSAFNNGSIVTSAQEVKTFILKEFERSLKFNLRADTYNPEDRSLGSNVFPVVSWQAQVNGDNKFDFDTLSAVRIAADANNTLGCGTSAISIDHVIGLSFDARALGFTFNKAKIRQNYVACGDFWTSFYGISFNEILDPNLGIVAYIVD